MMRRVVVSTLLAALVLSLTAWRETPPTVRGDGGVTVPHGPALGPEAPMRTKAETLTNGTAEHRPVKSRARLGLAVLVGLSVLVVVFMVARHRRRPGRPVELWWGSSATLLTPPVLRLA
jgi:hypothetical protein